MSSATIKEPSYYKLEIGDEEKKKLEKIFETMEKDPQAVDFLYPVDYVALNILDYPKIITHPMDLGTVKKNLENGEYKLFQDFMSDINLIWKNCRTYNQPGSEIVKMANHCDKKIKQLIDKQFKNYQNKANNNKKSENNSNLSFAQKTKLIENIKELTNDILTQIVKIILRECPKGIEDIDTEKLQIKVDLLDSKTYEIINQIIEKNKLANNDKSKSSKK
jgi:hypothetical protein